MQRLDHFRREGVSNFSHDLRSPLAAAAACLETLALRRGIEPARQDDRQLVEVALRNTRNAARLVQSLGDLAQLDEPEFRLHLAAFDTAELLDDIALRFAECAAQQSVSLSAERGATAAPCVAQVDIELFERAIANLVDNALKFSRTGDRVRWAAQAQGDRVLISVSVSVSVSDSGAGIAAVDLPHLFDRRCQSRKGVAPATDEGGKGLGLTIVKRIAELPGSDVQISSVIGKGSRVTVSLPRVA